MDHYKVLGVHKNAGKEEIKQAFRKLAMQFHPDKHSQSSKHSRDAATLKFKQLSEAYDVLIDDRKRADYNFKSRNTYTNTYQRYDTHNSSNSYGYGYSGSGSTRRSGETVHTKFEMGLRYLTTRAFRLNATFIGILLGGMYIVDAGGKALWNMHNPGKSFEEAMESVEKAKSLKDDSR